MWQWSLQQDAANNCQRYNHQYDKKTVCEHFDLLYGSTSYNIFRNPSWSLRCPYYSKSAFRLGGKKCHKKCHLFVIGIEPVELRSAAMAGVSHLGWERELLKW